MPPAVPRLDAAEVLARLARGGWSWSWSAPRRAARWVLRSCDGPDGHGGVLTRAGDGSAASEASLRLTADVLDVARAAGVPAPRYELIAGIDDAHAVVQEQLVGSVPEEVGPGLVRAMLGECERWAGLLAERAEIGPVSLHLTESGPGFCGA
ncbi:hypothetical protein [Pseudactinotalea terrae]|uniref:hypothetical protein n=1 Tax=Pseudactinotalea terrae TaxID=1743262 RepID=UPI0012E1E7FB|nr:hypothetical protein [Pseudactinotalea terrae]